MFKIAYIAAFVSVFAASLYFVLTFGMNPRPLPKIRPSHFETMENLGGAVTLRLREEIKRAEILAWGVFEGNEDHQDIWESFHRVNQEEGMRYDHVMIEAGLPAPREAMSWETIDLLGDLSGLTERLLQITAEGNRVMLILPYFYSAQSLQQSPVRHMVGTGLPLTSFTILPVALTADEAKRLPHPCPGSTDPTGFGPLGCAMNLKSTLMFRNRKLDPSRHIALMDQFGLTDYILFFRPRDAQ